MRTWIVCRVIYGSSQAFSGPLSCSDSRLAHTVSDKSSSAKMYANPYGQNMQASAIIRWL